MPIMVVYSGSGVSWDAYAPYEAEVKKTQLPAEGLAHQVAFNGDDFMIVDIWQTREAFDDFTRRYVKPALARLGLPYTEPRVYETKAMFIQAGMDAFRARALA